MQGLPAALMGLILLWVLPRAPLTARWLTVPEKNWLQRELARAQAIGHLVTAGGMLGVIGVLFVGWNSDRHGDRFRDACVCAIICMTGLMLIGMAPTPTPTPTPTPVMIGYLLFAATWFSDGVLIASSWADVLHPQQLAVGAAAINTVWSIGSFFAPYGFGLARDATGGYTLGLIGSAMVAGAQALLILYVRARVASERRARVGTAAQPVVPT